MTWFKLIITIRSTAPSHMRLRMRYCSQHSIIWRLSPSLCLQCCISQGTWSKKIRTADLGSHLSTAGIKFSYVILWQTCLLCGLSSLLIKQGSFALICQLSRAVINILIFSREANPVGLLCVNCIALHTWDRVQPDRFPLSSSFERCGEHTKFPLRSLRWRVLCSLGIRKSLCRLGYYFWGEKKTLL